MTEHILNWKKDLPPPGAVDDSLRLLEMPRGLMRPRSQIRAAEALDADSRMVLHEVLAALRAQANNVRPPIRVSLETLTERQRELVGDLLGEGEVRAQVGGTALWSIWESVLAGVWRVRRRAADGTIESWLEVGAMAEPALTAARDLPRSVLLSRPDIPTGAMNAAALLAELAARSRRYQAGEPNHVINFTLLPLSDVDADVLTSALGQIPLVVHSDGYGSCRIYASGLKYVWAVQYLNSMGTIILDTLEVGGIPIAALAATEDFADSAQRLTEMLDAYRS